MTDDDKVAAIKAVVYSSNPAHCGALDEVVGNLRWLDRTSAASLAGPMSPAIIDLIYVAHGSPQFEAGTPPPEPEVEEDEAKTRGKRRT